MELQKVIDKVKEEDIQRLCIQLPDGLKPKSQEIADKITKETGALVMIWAGSCYGACDLAVDVKRLGAQLLVAWGHSEWSYGSIF